MSELPPYASTLGWDWQRIENPGKSSHGFWIGTDRQGNRWLTKLRGSFYAYREVVFGRLAQAMNWSCQSSMFIEMDLDSAKILGGRAGDVHAVHWYMEEHASSSCCVGCVLEPLLGREVRVIEDLLPCKVQHLLDWPKSELAAYIFGGNEPPGRLITAEHDFVVIDSEQMFSTGPCLLDAASWLVHPDGSPSLSGKALSIEVCEQISKLRDAVIAQALTVPSEIHIEYRWPIAPKLQQSIEFASAYVGLHERL